MHSTTCPTCGGGMRFTMLGPGSTATATATLPTPVQAVKPEWHDPYKYGYEEIEAPWSFRYAQIGIGISSYFFISRLAVPVILLPLIFALSDKPPKQAALAALGGGAVAGFWARNWIPQGLGVAAGVLFIPLIIMLAFTPDNWPRFCITLGLTSVMTIVGAYLGHLLVKPTRIPKS
jgi:hypothetical protein